MSKYLLLILSSLMSVQKKYVKKIHQQSLLTKYSHVKTDTESKQKYQSDSD